MFSIFIDLITTELRCAYHLYADDLQLYCKAGVDKLSDAIEELNRDLRLVKSWSDRFGVAVNPLKCQAVMVKSPHSLRKLKGLTVPPVIFDNTVIPFFRPVPRLRILVFMSTPVLTGEGRSRVSVEKLSER